MRKLLGVGLLSFSLLSAGLAPAHAAATVLPDGANAGDDSAIQAFSCETQAQLWAPIPQKDDAVSSADARYSTFVWEVLGPGDELLYSEYAGLSSRDMSGFGWTHSTPLNAGDQYTVTLKGTGDSDDPTSIQVTMTVLDDEFSGSGAGTPEDPYRISSVDEMNQMRCIDRAYWRLTSDLDLSDIGDNWIPISNGKNGFWHGVLDGDGHTITSASIGHPQQNYVSLLGRAEHSTVYDLTLEDFNVTGASKVATLVAQSEDGLTLDNIIVKDANIITYGDSAGLLVGYCNYGCSVQNSNLQGDITGVVTAYVDGDIGELRVRGVSDVGGAIGQVGGTNGGSLADNFVDVEINVIPEANFAEIAAERGLDWPSSSYVFEIGGLIGDEDEDFLIRNNRASVNIHLETYNSLYSIGGAVGRLEGPMTGIDLASSIEIVALSIPGMSAVTLMREIGGAIGYSDDIALSRSRVVSNILVTNADGANNYHGIEADPYGEYFVARRIGGVYGEYDDDTADALNEVKTDIEILGVGSALDIGGYVGQYNSSNTLNPNQVVVSGRISIDAVDVESVGGFVGDLESSGILAGKSVISAVEMDLSFTDESSTGFGSVAGAINQPANNLPAFFYWDSSINDYENPVGHNYLPATTSQLQNRVFLTNAGFDMDNTWDLDGGYPELRPGFYGPGAGLDGSGDEGVQVGDSLVFVKGNREFTTAGGELELYGEGLRGVTLSVAGTPLYFKYITDTSGFALIPVGLSPGAYALVATTPTGSQTLQGAFTILGDGSNSTMKVWTKRLAGDTEAKFYAKNIIGEGKVRFVLNGREIAWINAVDKTDPKLRSANGAYYLVRTVSLKAGKNVLEIYVDGVRERRVVYTR